MQSSHFSLENISVAFGQDNQVRVVLHNISLAIQRGEWVAVVGRNGSGKSTLARVLAGLCAVSRGTARQKPVVDTGASTQMVFQNPEAQIVGETVYEDVCFGLENRAMNPDQMPMTVRRVLSQVGLVNRTGDFIRDLSGGQKQRLAIADALAMDAEAIVFDEATSMLDPAGRDSVIDAARDLHGRGTTIVWITQRLEELAFAPRVIALEQGQVSFDGTPQAFFYGSVAATDSNSTAQFEHMSPCTSLGFVPPHSVQSAIALRRRGVDLRGDPILPEQLSESIGELCRSN